MFPCITEETAFLSATWGGDLEWFKEMIPLLS